MLSCCSLPLSSKSCWVICLWLCLICKSQSQHTTISDMSEMHLGTMGTFNYNWLTCTFWDGIVPQDLWERKVLLKSEQLKEQFSAVLMDSKTHLQTAFNVSHCSPKYFCLLIVCCIFPFYCVLFWVFFFCVRTFHHIHIHIHIHIITEPQNFFYWWVIMPPFTWVGYLTQFPKGNPSHRKLAFCYCCHAMSVHDRTSLLKRHFTDPYRQSSLGQTHRPQFPILPFKSVGRFSWIMT